MERGKPASELPPGIRQDTRKHTNHCVRPSKEIVDAYLGKLTPAAFKEFARDYDALVEERFAEDRTPFDEIAGAAESGDVYLGCSCPTKKNPDVRNCHTTLALRFMKRKYPRLEVSIP